MIFYKDDLTNEMRTLVIGTDTANIIPQCYSLFLIPFIFSLEYWDFEYSSFFTEEINKP